MVLTPVQIIDIAAIVVGIVSVFVGFAIVKYIEGKGELKNAMLLATISALIFAVNKIVDYVNTGNQTNLSILESILFLLGIGALLSAGYLTLSFFKGISFNKR